jgi:hypothetical protein
LALRQAIIARGASNCQLGHAGEKPRTIRARSRFITTGYAADSI